MKIFYIILLLIISNGCTTDASIPVINNINNINEWEIIDKEILNLIQKYRTESELPLFIPSKDIRNIAIKRLEAVKLTYPITHAGVGTVFTDIKALGYDLPKELLIYGYSSSESVFNALVKSDKHNKALLEDNVYIGIYSLNYNNKNYYIVLFAR